VYNEGKEKQIHEFRTKKNVCEVYIDSSDFQRQQMYILTSVAVCFVYEKQISFELEFRLSFFRLIR